MFLLMIIFSRLSGVSWRLFKSWSHVVHDTLHPHTVSLFLVQLSNICLVTLVVHNGVDTRRFTGKGVLGREIERWDGRLLESRPLSIDSRVQILDETCHHPTPLHTRLFVTLIYFRGLTLVGGRDKDESVEVVDQNTWEVGCFFGIETMGSVLKSPKEKPFWLINVSFYFGRLLL